MTAFMVHFCICNLFICPIVGILFLVKRLFRNILTSRMQYDLWFLLLVLLTVPFIPFPLAGSSWIFSWSGILPVFSVSNVKSTYGKQTSQNPAKIIAGLKDFALSVNNQVSSVIWWIVFGIWLTGIAVMTVLMIKSFLHLHAVRKSALPLQNPKVRRLYNSCLKELRISKNIPILSTAFLKSPIITGFWKPCIYLPLSFISDYNAVDMRYMLLHELQHYRHKDMIVSFFMNLTGILYWFHPLVRCALKTMRNDREVACDTSVLMVLDESAYMEYGHTLLNTARKISSPSFPFAAGLSNGMKQMERRIMNIVSYRKPTLSQKKKGAVVFVLIDALLLSFLPLLSTHATDGNHYDWKSSHANISLIDLTSYFGDCDGCFVLYDPEKDSWYIHDMERALLRVSPDSTHKIYDALFALEEGIITPDSSLLLWNEEVYPFEEWNADQTLQTAMRNSVNWYFQEIDKQLGYSALRSYHQKIGYGNEQINGKISSYWLESSLKISPIEQVELLTALYFNRFDFAPENILAIKDSLCLSASSEGAFYGKTGTGRINEKDINGWFTGFAETAGHTYFFAVNISSDDNATGTRAAKIAMSVLADREIYSFSTRY